MILNFQSNKKHLYLDHKQLQKFAKIAIIYINILITFLKVNRYYLEKTRSQSLFSIKTIPKNNQKT